MAFGATYLANLIQARTSGRPMSIGAGLVVNPDGSVGTPGGGFATPWPATLPAGGINANAATPNVAAAQPATTLGLTGGVNAFGMPASPADPAMGTPSLSAQAAAYRNRTMPPMNQANPGLTAGIPGLPGTPSGPAVMPTAAAGPGATQGLGLTTDQLNAQSLAAARAGRTYWNPALNIQPGGDVVNALTAPPGANTMAGNALVPANNAGVAALAPSTNQQLAQLNAYRQWQMGQQALLSMYGGGGGP